MVLILINWLYITLICYAYGFILLKLLQKLELKGEGIQLPFSLVCLLGLAEVSALSTVLSLFINIGALAVVLTTLVPVIFFGFQRQICLDEVNRIIKQVKFTPPLFNLILVIIQVILAIKCSTNIFFHYDSGFYHLPSIRWIETYGVVPGLVNLFAPLGIDSIWFQTNALFGFAFLLDNPLHKVIGLTICWSIYLVLGRVKDFILNHTQPSFSLVLHVLTLIPLLELCSNLTSPSTDEPSAIFVLLVLVLTAQFIETQAEESTNLSNLIGIAIATFSVYAVTIKLSSIPILLCTLYVLWTSYNKRDFTWLILQGGVLAEFLIPKALRTLILTGYLLYPFPYLDIFNPDWKMPKSFVIAEMEWIQSWARLRFVDKKLVLSRGIQYWFPSWINTFCSSPIALGLIISISICLIGLVIWKQKQTQIVFKYGVLYITSFVGLLYWFNAAPYIRFGFGFLWGFILLLLVPPILLSLASNQPILLFHPQAYTGISITLLIALLPIMLYSASFQWQPLGAGIMPSKDFFVSASYRKPNGYPKATLTLRRACGFNVFQPIKNQLCWYSDVPCSPFYYGETMLRSSDLHDGFRSIQSCSTATTFQR
ncbi:hypothetical protein Syn7502_01347 [Synechococcus sp. PCC 7502]|uniref:LIC_10190 family membrane protein n=1 Tax=Synechococcus sp. PCC 7502 TaxID=1173263 RepID=UPI00029F84F1|nr:hypothetical protein [Synechococcus sp. PCC 7502]AFY73439.1 hypothetical protein Syn7502_01347 [Synechococcus sp. PCC 7502]